MLGEATCFGMFEAVGGGGGGVGVLVDIPAAVEEVLFKGDVEVEFDDVVESTTGDLAMFNVGGLAATDCGSIVGELGGVAWDEVAG